MIQTARKMSPSIGTEGTILLEGMSVAVKVIDMRQRYGTVDALIRPLQGHGEKWVEARRIQVSDYTAVS